MPHHLVCVEKFTLPYLTLPQVVRYLLMADSPLHLNDSQGRTPFEAAQFGDPTSGVNMGDDMLRETMELLTTHPAGAYIDMSSP